MCTRPFLLLSKGLWMMLVELLIIVSVNLARTYAHPSQWDMLGHLSKSYEEGDQACMQGGGVQMNPPFWSPSMTRYSLYPRFATQILLYADSYGL